MMEVCEMVLDNKLGITGLAELAQAEERISKKKALQLFESASWISWRG